MGGKESPFWLWLSQLDALTFHDEDEDEDPEDSDEDEDGEENDEEDPDDSSEDEDEDEDPAKGLKSALKKERAARKKADKELKALKKAEQQRKAKTSETDKAKGDAQEASEKAARLAAKLLENAVDTAIIKAVQKVKLPDDARFADVDDAIRLLDRGNLDVEQDEDDPAEVEIDEEVLMKALKKLAKSKPHLLIKPKSSDEEDEDDDEEEEDVKASKRSTGSKVGSRGTREKGKIKEETLKQRYPMLNR